MLAALALALGSPSGALASSHQQMLLQDDSELIYSTPGHVAQALMTLKAMGVDEVRVSVVWSLVSPDPLSDQKPSFNAADPAAYPAGAWDRYDLLDRLAHQLGIGVSFMPVAPAPNWATTPPLLPQGYRWSHDPSAQLYGQFVQAIAARYNGTFVAPNPGAAPSPLPAVTSWELWNEPNIGGWMTPQWRKLRNGTKVQASPAIYRGMVDAAWSGLVATGHAHDTILIGETAAYGAGHEGYGASMDPLTFVRAFYCLRTSYRPLAGASAAAIGCPRSGDRKAFVRDHPALFDFTGWAHHPYDFDHPPAVRRRNPNSATLSGINRIETALDRSFRAYHRPAGVPIYITEWGVQSRNPNPFNAFSQAQQAQYLNQGEYMAYRDPRVASFAQFLLVDDAPNTNYTVGTRAYWSTFDSGLLLYPGRQPKPAYYSFELPIWVPRAHHGPRVFVWAQIRSNAGKAGRVGTLQFRPQGSKSWTAVGTLSPSDPEGFATARVALHSAGLLRFAWTDPYGVVEHSRTVQVS